MTVTFFREYVEPLRASLAVAAGTCLLFILPSQMGEIYLIHRDDMRGFVEQGLGGVEGWAARLSQSAILYLSLWLLVTILAASTLQLLRQRRIALGQTREDEQASFDQRLLAVGVSLVPLCALTYGFWSAVNRVPMSDAPLFGGMFGPQHVLPLAALSIVVLHAIIWLGLAKWVLPHSLDWLFRLKTVVAASLMTVAVTLFFAVALASISQYMGTVSLLCLFASFLIYFASVGTLVYDRFGVPVLWGLLIAAIVWALFDLNNNHRVAYTVAAGSPPTLEDSFVAWASSRKDHAFYAERHLPYPVYLVSAEGGGLYAAFHTASFLAAVQDECPGFSQHLFAISSVSGGSLGAGVFAGLAHAAAKNDAWQACRQTTTGEGPKASSSLAEPIGEALPDTGNVDAKPSVTVAEPGPFARATRAFFVTDFLAPLVASALFPDFAQRFLPFPLTGDRAKALEGSFELAWEKAAANLHPVPVGNPFGNMVRALWTPDGATPALFINTTSIATGARISISPIEFKATPSDVHISTALTCDAAASRIIDLSLSTAISLSARFPWVTPVGWLERSSEQPPQPTRRPVVTQVRPGAFGPSSAIAAAFDPPVLRDDHPKISQGEIFRASCASGAAQHGTRLNLADGGYFENSGLESLTPIAARIRRYAAQRPELFPHGIAIKTVAIFVRDEFADRWWHQTGQLSQSSPSELLGPIEVLLNTRRARTRAVHSRLHLYDEAYFTAGTTHFQSSEITSTNVTELQFEHRDLYNVMLDGRQFFLPLGWHLSKSALTSIEQARSQETMRSIDLIRRDLMGDAQGGSANER